MNFGINSSKSTQVDRLNTGIAPFGLRLPVGSLSMDQPKRTQRGKAPIASRPRRSRVVWVIASAVAKGGKERQLRSLLRRMVTPTHAEPGCLIYDLYESEWPGKFFFYELWASRRDLVRHATSKHYQRLLEALPTVAASPLQVTLLNKLNL